MRTAKIKKIVPNYRRRVFDVTLVERRKSKQYHLPFGVFPGLMIGKSNLVTSLEIDKTLENQAVNFRLQDGSQGDFPADLVLYHCDPSYDWSPINQLKRALKGKIIDSRLSVRVMADALNTSPSQVVRLLEKDYASKQLLQLFQLAELAGYKIEFQLKKKTAA